MAEKVLCITSVIGPLLALLLSCYADQYVPGTVITLDNSSRSYQPHVITASLYSGDEPNTFLLAAGAAIIKLVEGSGMHFTVQQLVGHTFSTGYIDGPPLVSRFEKIGDFVQAENGRKIYITDDMNSCVRLFDRVIDQVTTFAGNCSEPGRMSGPLLLARFKQPEGLALVPGQQKDLLYLADMLNHRIAAMDLKLGNDSVVWTVVDYQMESALFKITQPVDVVASADGSALYVTDLKGIVKVTNLTNSLSKNSGASTELVSNLVVEGQEMLLLNQDKLFVADYTGNRLVVFDLTNGGHAFVCSSEARENNSLDGPTDSCILRSPQGLGVRSSNTLFITEYSSQSVSQLLRMLTYTVSDFTTTTTSTTTTTTTTATTPVSQTSALTTPTVRPASVVPTTSTKTGEPEVPEYVETTPMPDSTTGIAVGITVPLVLIIALSVFLVFCCRSIKRARREEKVERFVRRDEIGGYDGPAADVHSNEALDRRESNGDRSPNSAILLVQTDTRPNRAATHSVMSPKY